MKQIVSCFLSFVFILNFASCNNKDVIKDFQKGKTIAVKYASVNDKVADGYISDGFTKVTYDSSSDVVLAIENGKAQYGILDDFELNLYISAQRKIQKKERCGYSIDYCAYFSLENESLQKSFNKAIVDLKSDGTLDKIKNAHLSGKSFQEGKTDNEKGTLTMLCDPSFENRVFTDSNGEVLGLDVDMAREICNSLGYEMEIVTADFDELFIKLQEGEGDFIISACEVAEERAEYYLLSDAYFTLNYYLIEKE